MNKYIQQAAIFFCALIVVVITAALALLKVELSDKESAIALGSSYIVELDFTHSDIPAAQAYERLAEMNAELGLGLVKPLRRAEGETFVFLQHGTDFEAGSIGIPETVPRMDGSVSPVASLEALEHSLPGGFYLLCEEHADVDGFAQALREMGVEIAYADEVSDGEVFSLRSFRQPMILFSVLATVLLLCSLSVYWVGAHGRRRQQELIFGRAARETIFREILGLLLPFITVLAAGGGVFFLIVDSPFNHPVLVIMLKMYGFLIAVLLLLLAVMLCYTRPRVAEMRDRFSWLGKLHPLIVGMKILSLACVLFTLPWVASAHSDSKKIAQAHDVAYNIESFVGYRVENISYEQLEGSLAEFGELMLMLDREGVAAFNYLPPPLSVGLPEDIPPLAFANSVWLDAMEFSEHASADEMVSWEELPEQYREALYPNIWLREGNEPPVDWKYHIVHSDSGVGMLSPLTGGMELVQDMVLVEVPTLEAFDDSFLTSMMTSGNISAINMDSASRVLNESSARGLASVYYIGEESVYIAKMFEYRARIMALALGVLIIALVVALVGAAATNSVLHAKRNMLQHLAGDSLLRISVMALWKDIILTITLAALSATAAIIFNQQGIGMIPVVAVLLVAMSIGTYAVMAKKSVVAAMSRKI
ncbi:hypothetical protein [Corynebacterium lowii]|uniref:FtsX-like permease family protein n=1 Tax=Corynebacterium lowii TaxID=1544413 RepID=A0A0Q1AI16_9CORY|nr:hypothetical protein [Corynebacterium lowii]KQB86264.1 hypothetical protein Clow_01183 [Corynebacterium lowii]MDP9850749.1 hypothetical protein [Corynebacterium lowii]